MIVAKKKSLAAGPALILQYPGAAGKSPRGMRQFPLCNPHVML